MPSTWMLMTMPMTCKVAPPWCMCSGVITITEIITACAKDSAATPAATPGVVRATSAMRRHDLGRGGPAPRPRAASRATSKGSGRRNTTMTSAAAIITTRPNPKGPVSAGSPTDFAARPETPLRFGPATAPTVVAHTTTDSARARRSGRARSVAA